MNAGQISETERYLRSFLENGREHQAVTIFDHQLTGFLETVDQPVHVQSLNSDLQAMAAIAVRLFGNDDGPLIIENCCVRFSCSHPDILICFAVIEKQLPEGEVDGDAD